MGLEVRAARVEDLHTVLSLLRQMNCDDPPLAVADAERTWRQILDQPGRHVLIAVDEGSPIGTADCLVIPNLTRGARPYLLIENVVVDAQRRRDKVGTTLLCAALDLARREGCYKAHLLADDTPTNHQFYGSCGLEPTARGFKCRL